MYKIFKFLMKNDQVGYNKRIARLYKEIFNSPSGQEVLSDLIANSYILETTDADPIKEGIRKGILRILGILNYDQKKFQAITRKITDVDNIEDEVD